MVNTLFNFFELQCPHVQNDSNVYLKGYYKKCNLDHYSLSTISLQRNVIQLSNFPIMLKTVSLKHTRNNVLLVSIVNTKGFTVSKSDL